MKQIEMKEADAKEVRDLNQKLGDTTSRVGQLARKIQALKTEQMQLCAQAEQESAMLQDRISGAAKRYEIDLENTTGAWNLDLATGVFTFKTHEEIKEEQAAKAAQTAQGATKH